MLNDGPALDPVGDNDGWMVLGSVGAVRNWSLLLDGASVSLTKTFDGAFACCVGLDGDADGTASLDGFSV